MSDRVLIRFLAPYRGYNRGEFAGFQPRQAERVLNLERQGKPVAERASQDELDAHLARQKKEVQPLVEVRLTSQYGCYRPGEVAAFPADVARRMVSGWQTRNGKRRPCAVYVTEESSEAPSEAASEATAEAGSGDGESRDDQPKPKRRRKKKATSKGS